MEESGLVCGGGTYSENMLGCWVVVPLLLLPAAGSIHLLK